MKQIQLIMVNQSTDSAESIPAGISRIAVRGLRASKLRSRYLLKAIAALRAVTIHTNTNKNLKAMLADIIICKDAPFLAAPKKKPMQAKGNAKMVCENFTKLK